MSLVIADKYSKILAAFSKIGKHNGTAPPESKSNTFALAYEYYVAAKLESAAKKRKEQAQVACVSAGMLGDKADLVTGMLTVVYTSDIMNITAKAATPAKRIDPVELANELSKRYGELEALKIINAATKYNAPAVSYDFTDGTG